MLHAIVRAHLAGFLRFADERYAHPLPRYVRRAFEHYLRCGLPEHGFLRLRCDDCGHDRVVAFSCKERGTCPSCAGRTMSNTAAHLVDRVLPNVPIRQWVLSLPYDLRMLAAKRPDVVAAIDRILFREIERVLRRSYGPSDGRAGAVTFVQRFGGSLNLHVHFHVLVLEGLFTRENNTRPVFHESLAPTPTELLAVVTRVKRSVLRWLARRGLDRRVDDGVDADPDALDACVVVAIQPGLFDKLDGDAPFAPLNVIATIPPSPPQSAAAQWRSTDSTSTPPSPSAKMTTSRASASSAYAAVRISALMRTAELCGARVCKSLGALGSPCSE